MQAGSRGEHAGWFAYQLTGQPEPAGAIEKVFQWGSHVAEAGGAAQRQTGAMFKVIQRCVDGALLRDRRRNSLAFR